ncbi:MAG: hypothetical protein VKI42_05465 [Synechococcaceae cyanobacterium]|nr:hypothetical protein [Synechococcaceae cyanobacterium]
MKTPDTFKGFGIPQLIEIIRLKENSEAEFDRALARYRRQGMSTEDAVQFVGISVLCLQLEQHGFQPGRDFRYVSTRQALALSPAAKKHLQDAIGADNWDQLTVESLVPDPLEIDHSDIRMVEGEPFTSPATFAKAVVGRLLGRELPVELDCIKSWDGAGQVAGGLLLEHLGLSEDDATDLLRNALAGADGAEERLVQRLTQAIEHAAQEGGEEDSKESDQ